MSKVITEADIWSRIDKSSGCWKWTGFHARGIEPRGHFQGKAWDMRKWVYARLVGDRPFKSNIVTSCGNAWCMSPAHMHLGRRRHPSNDIPAEQARLLRLVRKTKNGCWNFRGSRTTNGYGILSVNDKTTSAHRHAYKVFVCAIEDGVPLLHSCNNPSCINPDHLRIGDQIENMKDRKKAGRYFRTGVKLTPEQVQMVKDSDKSIRALAEELGVRQYTISCIRKGKTWKSGVAYKRT